MDELQAIFTTSNDPHKLFTLSFVTPPAVVGKLVKPAKTITKKPPKEKTEAKIDRFNPDIVDKASDNTDALDDDERKAGMRSRCVWYKKWTSYRAIYVQGIRRMVWTTQCCKGTLWIAL